MVRGVALSVEDLARAILARAVPHVNSRDASVLGRIGDELIEALRGPAVFALQDGALAEAHVNRRKEVGLAEWLHQVIVRPARHATPHLVRPVTGGEKMKGIIAVCGSLDR